MFQKQKIIVAAIFLLVLCHDTIVVAAGTSTDFSVPTDSISTELHTGSSTDFSVLGGLTELPVGGGSTDFSVEPAVLSSSSSSSSSSTSSSSSSVPSTAAVTTTTATNGGGSRHGFTVPERTDSGPVEQPAEKTAGTPSSSAGLRHSAAGVTSATSVAENASDEVGSTSESVRTFSTKHTAEVESVPSVSASPIAAGTQDSRTENTNPFIAVPVATEEMVTFQIFDGEGNLLHMNHVLPEQGMMTHRLKEELVPGLYRVVLRNEQGTIIASRILEVVASTALLPIEADSFQQNGISASSTGRDDLGLFVRDVHSFITGRATPNVRIVGYFRSMLRTSETMSDSKGYFALPIPPDLEDGAHGVTIVQYSSGDHEYSEVDHVFTLVTTESLHSAPTQNLLSVMIFLLLLVQIFALLMGLITINLHRSLRKNNYFYLS